MLDNFIEDLIFLCSLYGNDFLYAVPGFSLEDNNSWRSFIKQLVINFDESFIVSETCFNLNKLAKILKKILEETNLQLENKNKSNPKLSSSSTSKKQNFSPKFSLNETSKPNSKKAKYYSKNLGGGKKDQIKTICEEYVKGLCWVHSYYSGKKVDLEWYYPYCAAPMLEDLSEITIGDIDADYHHEGEEQQFVTPLEQLMYVLCKKSKEILPEELHSVFDIENVCEINGQANDIFRNYEKNIKPPFMNQKKGEGNLRTKPGKYSTRF